MAASQGPFIFLAGAVGSVANADGSLTIAPTTGAVVASINPQNPNFWSGQQSFGNSITFSGTVAPPNGLASMGNNAGLGGGNGPGSLRVNTTSGKSFFFVENGSNVATWSFVSGAFNSKQYEFQWNGYFRFETGVPTDFTLLTIYRDSPGSINFNTQNSSSSGQVGAWNFQKSGSNVLVIGSGGTFTTYAGAPINAGDLWYGGLSGQLIVLPIGTSGQKLTVGLSGLPVWM